MRRQKEKPHVNHERWLVSYADFITLMFALFVVLYASSQADRKKQAEISQSINHAFQALGLFQPAKVDPNAKAPASSTDSSVMPMNIVLGDELAVSPAIKKDFERIQAQLQGKLSNQIAQHVVALHIGRDGLVISLREAGFYDSGSATPHQTSMGSINAIASALSPTPYDIRVEGHTDNIPIHTDQFDSNWELSTARATRLTRYFIEQHQLRPERLSASGYAEFHPVSSNDIPEGRGQNRRVDIILLPHVTPTQRIDIPAPQAQPVAAKAAPPAARH